MLEIRLTGFAISLSTSPTLFDVVAVWEPTQSSNFSLPTARIRVDYAMIMFEHLLSVRGEMIDSCIVEQRSSVLASHLRVIYGLTGVQQHRHVHAVRDPRSQHPTSWPFYAAHRTRCELHARCESCRRGDPEARILGQRSVEYV